MTLERSAVWPPKTWPTSHPKSPTRSQFSPPITRRMKVTVWIFIEKKYILQASTLRTVLASTVYLSLSKALTSCQPLLFFPFLFFLVQFADNVAHKENAHQKENRTGEP